MLQSELQVVLVFVGQRGDGHRRTGQVDSLMLAECTSVEDFALHVLTVNREHSQFDTAVAEKNAGAGLDFARQTWKVR